MNALATATLLPDAPAESLLPDVPLEDQRPDKPVQKPLLTARADNLLLDAPVKNLFLAALAEIDKTLRDNWMSPRNRDKALAQAAYALTFATVNDRAFLNYLVDCFRRLPFHKALGVLERYGHAHPEHAQRFDSCIPDSNPGLYIRDVGNPFFTGLAQAEMPRMSVRFAYRPPILEHRPSPATLARTDTPEMIVARAQRYARHQIVHVIDARGPRRDRDLLRMLPAAVASALNLDLLALPQGPAPQDVDDAFVAFLLDLDEQKVIRWTADNEKIELAQRGVAVDAPRIRSRYETPGVTEYFRFNLFHDWQADLDRARRKGNAEWEMKLLSEPPIEHDQVAIRAQREFVRPILAAARAEAAVREEKRQADPQTRVHRSRLRPGHDVATEWDRVYLDYVAEQLTLAAIYDDPRPAPQRGQARQQNAGEILREASYRQRVRYTAPGTKLLPDSTLNEDSYLREAKPIKGGSELVELISSQVSEGYHDANPMPTTDEDDSIRRACIRTGIWTSTDYRDAPEHRGDGVEVDYDKAAKAPVRGWPCVWCFIERSCLDSFGSDTQDSDDGLCEVCRDNGRPGIPPLPEAFTYTDTVHAHCAFLASEYPTRARAMLRAVWQRFGKGSRTAQAISAFMAAHPEIPDTPVDPATDGKPAVATVRPRAHRGPVIGKGMRRARCRGCFADTGVAAHGYCVKCQVALGMIQPASASRSDAA